jgi:hypothetical protein
MALTSSGGTPLNKKYSRASTATIPRGFLFALFYRRVSGPGEEKNMIAMCTAYAGKIDRLMRL